MALISIWTTDVSTTDPLLVENFIQIELEFEVKSHWLLSSCTMRLQMDGVSLIDGKRDRRFREIGWCNFFHTFIYVFILTPFHQTHMISFIPPPYMFIHEHCNLHVRFMDWFLSLPHQSLPDLFHPHQRVHYFFYYPPLSLIPFRN